MFIFVNDYSIFSSLKMERVRFYAECRPSLRINYKFNGWNNACRHRVSHSHPSIWTAIEKLQLDQAVSHTASL